MGEEHCAERKQLGAAVQGALAELEAEWLRVGTPGGRFQFRWDEGGERRLSGQLGFFAEFLEVYGLFARWRNSCPLTYTSPNAPGWLMFSGRGCCRFPMAGRKLSTRVSVQPRHL